MNSFFFLFSSPHLHWRVGTFTRGRAFGDRYVSNSQLRHSQIHANVRPWRSSYILFIEGELNVPDGWMDRTFHICALQARAEAAAGVIPQQKVLKHSVGRQEMANCISFSSFIKENAKCVELSLLYIQLQSTRRTGSSMARPQARKYCETHA